MIPLSERERICDWVDQAQAAGARRSKVCEIVEVTARTLQRWRQSGSLCSDARSRRVFEPGNKLREGERAAVLAVANTAPFCNLAPSQIVPILAEQGEYIASESTFYRVLREAKQLSHRHASRPPRQRHKPQALQAKAPNEVYSWDITYLPTTVKGQFFYLYLFMDIYSRKIVGWQVYERECNEAAAQMMLDLAKREGINPQQLTLHSDNGGPMKGATLLATLQTLGIVPSFSRPSVSNDNPYSESLFKTLKYHRAYPDQAFADLRQARQWVDTFVQWYNHEHRHSAIKFVTPAQRHAGEDHAILARRHAVYTQAKARCPQRWSGTTRNWKPVSVVYLNPNNDADGRTKQAAKQAA